MPCCRRQVGWAARTLIQVTGRFIKNDKNKLYTDGINQVQIQVKDTVRSVSVHVSRLTFIQIPRGHVVFV
jgi:hypothetical protein